MAKANKKEEKKIQVKIVYGSFKDKYTKKMYQLGEVIEVTEKRLEEIKALEITSGKKLIEVIEETPINNDTVEDIGVEKENDAE